MSQKEVISLHYVLPVVTVYWYLVEEVENYSQGPFIPNKCLNAASASTAVDTQLVPTEQFQL